MKLDSAVFYTNDVEKSVDFFKNVVGLKLEYLQEDEFASFKFSNGVRLSIKKAYEEREKPGAQTIFIEVDNAGKLFEEMNKKGKVSFCKKLTKEKWGVEFAVFDPDRNKVEFLERHLS